PYPDVRGVRSFPTRRSSDLLTRGYAVRERVVEHHRPEHSLEHEDPRQLPRAVRLRERPQVQLVRRVRAQHLHRRLVLALVRIEEDRKSTRLNSSHVKISYAA